VLALRGKLDDGPLVEVSDFNGLGGRVFKKITPEAMRNATNVSETRPRWEWTAEDPFND
jgi:hypothetical protein